MSSSLNIEKSLEIKLKFLDNTRIKVYFYLNNLLRERSFSSLSNF